MKYVYAVDLNFRVTVKKLANALDLSARPETPSITMIQSVFIFSP